MSTTQCSSAGYLNLGQSTPDTSVDEGGGILGFRNDDGNRQSSFMPKGSGGILDDPRFTMADFSKAGYPLVKISFKAFPAISDDLRYFSVLRGDAEVPTVQTDATGLARYDLFDNGQGLSFIHLLTLKPGEIVAAHLHLGSARENGPVIVALVDDSNRDLRLLSRAKWQNGRRSNNFPAYASSLQGNLSSSDLASPLQSQPLDALVHAIQEGNV